MISIDFIVKNLISNKSIRITIPYNFLLKELISFAISLKKNWYFYNTNRRFSYKKNTISYNNIAILNLIQSSASVLSSNYALSTNINIPIITILGFDCLSTPVVINCGYGAYIVDIGSVLCKYHTMYDMTKYIYEIFSFLLANKSFKNINLDYINYMLT